MTNVCPILSMEKTFLVRYISEMGLSYFYLSDLLELFFP